MSEPARPGARGHGGPGGADREPDRSQGSRAPRGVVIDHYLFEKARALHQGGHFGQAEECYRELLERDPRSFKVLNNLGVLFEALGRTVEAEWAYRRALEIEPRSARAHFNLGHAMHCDGRLEQAEQSYRLASQLEPDEPGSHFNLGRLLHDQGRFEEAEACFRRALEIDSESAAAYSCLGETLYQQGRMEGALACFRRAIELAPEAAAEHFHAGKTLDALGRVEEAAASYRRSLQLRPESPVARENLARSLERLGRLDDAIQVLEEWQMLEPLQPVANHLLAAMSGRNAPARASDAYVRETFDRFAADFDATLERLDYRAPQLVAATLSDACGAPGAALEILDAGCGTGLCGPLLRPFARRLTGVDLSEGMLAHARRRGSYDELAAAELVAYLREHAEKYDAIVSADTLVYFGALEPVFTAAAVALRTGGLLIFTLEDARAADEAATYGLHPTGRFSHSERYLRRSLEQAGFTPRAIEHAALRRERAEPVAGFVVRAERCA